MTNDHPQAPRPPDPSSRPERRRGPSRRNPYPTWTALNWLFLFRLVLVVGLVLVFSPASHNPLIVNANTPLAWRVLVVYAVLVLLSGFGLYARWPRREIQVYLAVIIDIIAFTLLMHAGGGVGSGLGALLAVAVAAGALLVGGRLSLLFAAFATLAVMAAQTYVQLYGPSTTTAFTQAGLLGIVFFAVAILAHVLYRRVRDIEELAARRKVDIDDLSKLNDFIIQNMGTGVLVVDGERRMRLMNQAARSLLSTPDAQTGMELQRFCPPLADWLKDHVRPSAPQAGIVRVGDRELKPSRQLLGDFRAAGVLLFLRDNQELAREAQQIKLASLGTLTASIAHNIRNPLSAISHAAQLLAEAEGLSGDDRHLLDIIRRNTGRIDETVDSVLQLSRRNQLDLRLLELVAWVEAFSEEFRESQRLQDEALTVDLDAAPIAVEVDPRHLHQIVANLCENALLHASTPDRPAQVQLRVGRNPGDGRAIIEVCDDGPGVDEATAREMFTPFFTTRASGTGLGLYIARELAETNGIRLHYRRNQPNGSCFQLVFG